ncbi:uncharacterized protein LOC143036655 [Oratosquilla oratoria]|uniref:uncharacterized protein LOC143036655 n=1 Tax=Oratosquilla oratoria TaxID=337810 RepID=UPI003F76DE8F
MVDFSVDSLDINVHSSVQYRCCEHKETGDVGARLKDKIVITGDIKARLKGDHGHWSDLFHLDCFALTRLFVVPFCRGNPVGSSRSFLVTAARDSSTSTPVLQPGSSSDPVLQQGASSDPVLQLVLSSIGAS